MELIIRKKRIARNWTQGYVAEKIGLTRTAVHDIETGKQKPSFSVLLKICELFNANKDDIEHLFSIANDHIEAPESQKIYPPLLPTGTEST